MPQAGMTGSRSGRWMCEVLMTPSSTASAEITRRTAARIQAVILQQLADVTQEHAAACIGRRHEVLRGVFEQLEHGITGPE